MTALAPSLPPATAPSDAAYSVYAGTPFLLRVLLMLVLTGVPALSLPVWWGAIADARGYSLVDFGFVQAGLSIGAFVGGVLLTLTLPRLDRRWTAVAGCLGMAMAEAAVLLVSSIYAVAVARCAFMFSLSLVTGVGTVGLSHTRDPSRSFGWYMTGQTFAQAAALFVLPHLAAWAGIGGVQAAHVAFALTAAAVASGLPRREPAAVSEGSGDGARTGAARPLAIAAALAASVLFTFYTNDGFNYAERFGRERGLDPVTIGVVLSATMLAGLAGSLLASWLGDRIGRLRPVLGGAVLGLGVCALYLRPDTGTVGFATALTMFSITWSLVQPYLLAIVASVDPQGRALVASGPINGVASVGTVAAVTTATRFYGVGAVAYACMIFIGLTALAAWAALRLLARDQPTEAA